MSALGSVWDSLGMGLVGKEYFRSCDSSQPLLWTPGKPVQPSLSAGSTSTTVAAAMLVDKRWLAASVLLTMNQPETGLSSGLHSARLQSQRCDFHTIFPIHRYYIDQGNLCGPTGTTTLSGSDPRVCLHKVLTARVYTTQTKIVRKRFINDIPTISDSDT